MNIEVRIRSLIDDGSRIKARLSITLDGKFAIHDLRLVQRRNGSLFVAMPNRRDENGVFRDIAHPVGCEARQELMDAVVQAYQDYIDANVPLPF